jgi:hypothetical protein
VVEEIREVGLKDADKECFSFKYMAKAVGLN